MGVALQQHLLIVVQQVAGGLGLTRIIVQPSSHRINPPPLPPPPLPDRAGQSPRLSPSNSTGNQGIGNARVERRQRDNIRSPTPTRSEGASEGTSTTPNRSGNAGDRTDRLTRNRPRLTDRERESRSPRPARPAQSASLARGEDTAEVAAASPAVDSAEDEKNAVLNEKERKEIERQRRDLEVLKSEQREADRMELVRVAAERQKRIQADRKRRGSDTREFMLLSRAPINEAIIVPDYIRALISTLRDDPTAGAPGDAGIVSDIRLFFKVVQARGLIAKEGRTRDAYCSIEFGDLSGGKKGKHAPKNNIWKTETVTGSTNPVWNQHLNFDLRSLTDKSVLKCGMH
ncbi:hypothetical protein BASA83_007019 [Batrachochytrium salamandrivorans]|nr:hypothetical protein BASA83_007019 [Batrachochytrium salamandrivorans]